MKSIPDTEPKAAVTRQTGDRSRSVTTTEHSMELGDDEYTHELVTNVSRVVTTVEKANDTEQSELATKASRVATTNDQVDDLEQAKADDLEQNKLATESSRVETTNEQVDELEQAELEAAAERNTELHLLLDDDQDLTRAVVTDDKESLPH